MSKRAPSGGYLVTLAMGALGVVYGDIGTSPLYALRECFHPEHGVAVTRGNVLGVVSLIVWSLVSVISVKYLGLVMRANNRGEGGILSLLALAFPERQSAKGRGKLGFMLGAGVFGAALLYGDGMITPAISVLSAVEGLDIATPMFQRYVVPITLIVLAGLFSFQKIGTGAVGRIFGPVMVLWFGSIAALGVWGIWQAPEVLGALNPWYGIRFFIENGLAGFIVLGAVFLAVTGGEALYADMGHFGRRPIAWAWFGLVFPALLLNYFGQGGLLLRNAAAAANPFYKLVPSWALLPMVGLATAAAVIASQALISGVFSLTMQAIQLGYAPRLKIDHTSSAEKGQIFIGTVNRALMVACLGLVIGFGSSSNLAAAYGVAVTLTMLITTMLFYFAARRLWHWRPLVAGLICAPFLLLEAAFFGANLLKLAHGGWFPLVVALGFFTLMSTWKRGRAIVREKLRSATVPIRSFLQGIVIDPPIRVPGTAVFMSGSSRGTPSALLHNLVHNKVLHQRVVVLTIETDEVPVVDDEARIEIEQLQEGFYRIVGHYGFMEEPNVPALLRECEPRGLSFRLAETTFFLGRETIMATETPGMALWRERLFAFMAQNAQRATAFFGLPANRVVELGVQVEI